MCAEPETTNGTNGLLVNNPSATPVVQPPAPHHSSSPYQSVGDFLSNVDKFQIIESTLREGEQFANAFFDTGTVSAPHFPHCPILTCEQKPRSRCTPSTPSPLET